MLFWNKTKIANVKAGIKENIGIYPAINGNAGAMVNAILTDEDMTEEELDMIYQKSAELSEQILKVVNKRITETSGPIAAFTALSHAILSVQNAMLEDEDWKQAFDQMNQMFIFLSPNMGKGDNRGYA